MTRPLLHAAALYLLGASLFLPLNPSVNAEDRPSAPAFVLTRVSPPWKNPGVASLGLPSLRNGIARFAIDAAIYEGPVQEVRATLRSGEWNPDANETFIYFQRDNDRLNYDLQADDAGMVFVGKNRKGEYSIYRTALGKLGRAWVKPSQPIPHGVGSFERIQYPSARGDVVVFLGTGPNGQKGVYRADKTTIQRVADTSMTMPGSSEKFYDFSYAAATKDGATVFTGYSKAGSGVFRFQEGKLQALVDKTKQQPHTSQFYAGALLAAVEEPWVYFTSFGGTLSIGRVQLDGSALETLVDEKSFADEQGRPIGAINYASVDHGRILFEAAMEGTEFNLFLYDRGSVKRLVRRGEALDGGIIVGVRSGLQSLYGEEFICQIDLQQPGVAGFERSIYAGRLSGLPPVHSIAKVEPKISETPLGWFKLGQAPKPVFARERRSLDTNFTVRATGPSNAAAEK